MENKKEGTKTWIVASIFLLFGIVLSLLLVNSGITGNALINLPSGIQATTDTAVRQISAVKTPSTALSTIGGDMTLTEMCGRASYNRAQLTSLLVKLNLQKLATDAELAGLSMTDINLINVAKNAENAGVLTSLQLDTVRKTLLASRSKANANTVAAIDKLLMNLDAAKTGLVELTVANANERIE